MNCVRCVKVLGNLSYESLFMICRKVRASAVIISRMMNCTMLLRGSES